MQVLNKTALFYFTRRFETGDSDSHSETFMLFPAELYKLPLRPLFNPFPLDRINMVSMFHSELQSIRINPVFYHLVLFLKAPKCFVNTLKIGLCGVFCSLAAAVM